MEKDSVSAKYEALIIGGSAGSLEVILKMLPDLDENLSLAVIIVLHRKSASDSTLSNLLGFKTKLKVKEAEEKEEILPGIIYIAPADYHLLVEKDRTVSLDYSEKVNYSRPSIDVTFETAAEVYKSSLICLLLSGANADGTEGLKKVKKEGGLTVVQNPASADVPFMPQQAIDGLQIDYILHEKEMAAFINALSKKQ